MSSIQRAVEMNPGPNSRVRARRAADRAAMLEVARAAGADPDDRSPEDAERIAIAHAGIPEADTLALVADARAADRAAAAAARRAIYAQSARAARDAVNESEASRPPGSATGATQGGSTAPVVDSDSDKLAERARKRRKALERLALRTQRYREASDARYASVKRAANAPHASSGAASAAAGVQKARPAPVKPSQRQRSAATGFGLDAHRVADYDSSGAARSTAGSAAKRLHASARNAAPAGPDPVAAGGADPVDPAAQGEAVVARDGKAAKLRKGVSTSGRRVRIQLDELFASGYLKGDAKELGALGEEFRRIKRPLLANAYGQGFPKVFNGERIMVTSALPNEGKSFCAIHLALSIAAEVDNSVIVVEADVAKPTVLKKLGIPASKGLTNWCANPRLDVRDLVLDTELRGFRILPAGRGAPHSIDLLASRAMNTLFDRLREAYPHDLIIIDAPPLLPATETKVLASLVGQVVLVVEAGETPREVVTDALEMVKDVEVVGLVLNKSLRQSRNAGYGYGYGY